MAASQLVDLVKVNSSTVGTGPLVLVDAVAGNRGIDALIDGTQYSYTIQQGSLFEYGTGIWDAGTLTLSRDPIESSAGPATPVPFDFGVEVSFVALAEDIEAAATGINDSVVSSGSTWSSAKGVSYFQPLNSVLTALTDATAFGIAWAKSANVAAAKTSLSLVKGDVGLGNVDNTSDANKPISTATATALALKAPIDSPALTGVPLATTASPGDNTPRIATTAFVQTATGAVINDGVTSSSTTWSSTKLASYFQPLNSVLTSLTSATSFGVSFAQAADAAAGTALLNAFTASLPHRAAARPIFSGRMAHGRPLRAAVDQGPLPA